MRHFDAHASSPRRDTGKRLLSCAARALACGVLFIGLALAAPFAQAHKSSDSYLQLDAAPGRLEVRWDIALRDLDVALDIDSDADGKLTWGEVRAAMPRIESYALQRLAIDDCKLSPSGRAFERRNDGAYVVFRLESTCTLASPPRIAYSLFSDIDPTHRGIVKIQRPGAQTELLVLTPSPPPLAAAGSASSAGAVATAQPISRWQFLSEGVRHILSGYDHVLFLLCLLLPSVMKRTPAGWRPVERWSDALLPILGVISAFTVAHAITLGLASLRIVSLSSAIIEPAIAVTIMLAALDNVLPIFPVPRFVMAFCFGLVHGFGFASVLAELNLAPSAFAWALLQFNVGLEAGQLMVAAVVVTVLFMLRRQPGYLRWVIRGGSIAAFVLALLWFIERTANVSILPA